MFIIAVFGSFILQFKVVGSSNSLLIEILWIYSIILCPVQLTKTGDIIGILQIAMTSLSSLLPFFLFCHFGGNITQQFEEIGDAAYQLEWYRLPLDMQKDIRIVIAAAQKSIYMRGYGDTRSTYSVLTKVRKIHIYKILLDWLQYFALNFSDFEEQILLLHVCTQILSTRQTDGRRNNAADTS